MTNLTRREKLAYATIAKLEAEIETIKKDAERYRFAKATIREDYELGNTTYCLSDNSAGWDRTIDKAMEENNAANRD